MKFVKRPNQPSIYDRQRVDYTGRVFDNGWRVKEKAGWYCGQLYTAECAHCGEAKLYHGTVQKVNVHCIKRYKPHGCEASKAQLALEPDDGSGANCNHDSQGHDHDTGPFDLDAAT